MMWIRDPLCEIFAQNTCYFYKQHHAQTGKNDAKAKEHPEAETVRKKMYKYVQKSKCGCLNEIIWLIVMEMKMIMTNWLHK